MDKVSVIIPTYNRFKYLLNAIESVRNQTYKNIEIIVVNDRSTQQEYYDFNFGDDVKIFHLAENSRIKFSYPCAGYVRNYGIIKSTGKYVAFIDDDDYWLPDKLEKQISAMLRTGCKMSSTDAYHGKGPYDHSKCYRLYNKDVNFQQILQIYHYYNSKFLDKGFPDIFTLDLIKIHNCILTSTVVIEKDILLKVKLFPHVKNGKEDWSCWLKCLIITDCVYVQEPCIYYDDGHGDGQQY